MFHRDVDPKRPRRRRQRASRYRVGLIGCGAIGSDIADGLRDAPWRLGLPYGHASVYQSLERTELVAAADIAQDRLDAFAQRWNFPRRHLYCDVHDMLANARLDVVSIASPTPSHAEMTLAAITAGVRAIFLEKPTASIVKQNVCLTIEAHSGACIV
ncbi:MAG: Gfo/Idh/MocA family oxidoreductase [Chloroflexota bacterium]|nr:Gfo/Idh/MocA family oxidoreductase [Chloroflexota bacterium]